MVVLAIHQRDIEVLVGQLLGTGETTKAAADDHDPPAFGHELVVRPSLAPCQAQAAILSARAPEGALRLQPVCPMRPCALQALYMAVSRSFTLRLGLALSMSCGALLGCGKRPTEPRRVQAKPRMPIVARASVEQ